MKTKKPNKRRYVIWLHNFTDERDDEWVKVQAASEEEAKEVAKWKIDTHRFRMGRVYNTKEWRKNFGNL